MSSQNPQFAGHLGASHPVVTRRRIRDLLVVSTSGLAAVAVALGITVENPKPNPVLVFGVLLGLACVVALLVSRRYEVTVALLALYLGLFDGPVKLESATQATSGVRDVFLLAICLGIVLRLIVGRQRVSLPPLSGWVLAFVAVVLVEALNPNTHGILKSLGGYRQQLEWVPFFFFGYLLIRTKERFRNLFLILGVMALANGFVGSVQSALSPAQLARWGPGYNSLVYGGKKGSGLTGRTYISEGEARARPPALGSDSGFGGAVGAIALPGLLALLAAGRLRRRWPVLLCCMGALLGVATAASRTSVVVAVVGLLLFALLSFVAGLRVSRPLAGVVVIVVMAVAAGSALIAADGTGVLARQETLTSAQKAQETGGGAKERSLSQIPYDVSHAPFGLGLGTAGAVSGFGGKQKLTIEGQKVVGGSAYSLLMKELGLLGLVLWIGLSVNVIFLAVRGLRRVQDTELRTYLVALVAGFIALTVEGLSGPTLAVSIGAYLWFVPGVVAYWFAGAGRKAMRSSQAVAL